MIWTENFDPIYAHLAEWKFGTSERIALFLWRRVCLLQDKYDCLSHNYKWNPNSILRWSPTKQRAMLDACKQFPASTFTVNPRRFVLAQTICIFDGIFYVAELMARKKCVADILSWGEIHLRSPLTKSWSVAWMKTPEMSSAIRMTQRLTANENHSQLALVLILSKRSAFHWLIGQK